MRGTDRFGLAPYDFEHVRGEGSIDRFLVALLCGILTLLHRFQNGVVTPAEAYFDIDPFAMQCARGRAGAVRVPLPEITDRVFQLTCEARPLHALLQEVGPDLSIGHVFSGIAISVLPIATGLDQLLQDVSIIFLISHGCSPFSNELLWMAAGDVGFAKGEKRCCKVFPQM